MKKTLSIVLVLILSMSMLVTASAEENVNIAEPFMFEAWGGEGDTSVLLDSKLLHYEPDIFEGLFNAADFEKLTDEDGNELEKSYYSVENTQKGVVIILSEEYLKTLKLGEYYFTAHFKNARTMLGLYASPYKAELKNAVIDYGYWSSSLVSEENPVTFEIRNKSNDTYFFAELLEGIYYYEKIPDKYVKAENTLNSVKITIASEYLLTLPDGELIFSVNFATANFVLIVNKGVNFVQPFTPFSGVSVTAPDAFVYDTSTDANYANFNISAFGFSDYEKVWLDFEYNKEIFEYKKGVKTESEAYSQSVEETEKGVRYNLKYSKGYNNLTSAEARQITADYVVSFKVTGCAAPNFTVTAKALNQYGDVVDLPMECSEIPQEVVWCDGDVKINLPELIVYDDIEQNTLVMSVLVDRLDSTAKDFTVYYNPDVLEFLNAENIPVYENDCCSATVKENGLASINIYAKCKHEGKIGDLSGKRHACSFNFTFNVKKSGDTKLEFFVENISTEMSLSYSGTVTYNDFSAVVVDNENMPVIEASNAFRTILGKDTIIVNRQLCANDFNIYFTENITVKDRFGNILASDSPVPTGAVISTSLHGYTARIVNVCILGDVDCDGKVAASDARMALRISAKLEDDIDDFSIYAGDINENGKIDAADAREILRVCANLSLFPKDEVKLSVGESITIGNLDSEANQYTWFCYVDDINGLGITEAKIEKDNPFGAIGAGDAKAFTVTALAKGTYTLTFAYSEAWNGEIIDSFEKVIVVE